MFVIDNARKRSTFRHQRYHDVHYPEKPYTKYQDIKNYESLLVFRVGNI